MKNLICKLHLLMVTVFAFESDICLGEGDAQLGTVPGTMEVLTTGRQKNGLAFPFHNLPFLPNVVMDEMKIKSVRNSSVYWLEDGIKLQIFAGILGFLGGSCSAGLSRRWSEAWVTGHWPPSCACGGTCATRADAHERALLSLPLETKHAGG